MAQPPTMEQKHPELFAPNRNIDRRTCTRVVPMECLSLGFGRTGTASMQAALTTLGLPCYHAFRLLSDPRDGEMWERALDAKFFGGAPHFAREQWDQLLGHVGAVTDVPAICFAEDLVAAYPEAKVVLVEREVEAWYRSWEENAIGPLWAAGFAVVAPLDPWFMGPIRRMHMKWANGWFGAYSREEMKARSRDKYREHYELVRMVTPKDRLLEYQLGSGWGPLCEFLGKPVPDVPFPRINEAQAMQEKMGLILRRAFAKVARRGLLLMLPVFGVFLAWWVYTASL